MVGQEYNTSTTGPKEYEYLAFISYKRSDEKWARWLQNKLERYKIPTALKKSHPCLPDNLRPVFRDKTDLSGGGLTEEIRSALDKAKYLIVLCSPEAAKSEWVSKEITYFIDSGRTNNIIPYIISGQPFAEDPNIECFPSQLRSLTGDLEILGINVNEAGRKIALIKLIARILQLKFDELWIRQERLIRRRRLFLLLLLVCLFFAVSLIATWIWRQNILLKHTTWSLLESQSHYIAEKAINLVKDGDYYLAKRLAAVILPDNLSKPIDRPYVPDAEFALREAWKGNGGVIRGHLGEVYSVAINPDGSLIASGGNKMDPVIRLWRTSTGEQVGVPLTGHFGAITGLAFSPDGHLLASCSEDQSLKVWNVETMELQNSFYGHSSFVYSVIFSPDGSRLLSGSFDRTIRTWDIHTGKEIESPISTPSGIKAMDISPDGTMLITGHDDKTTRIWDIKCRRQLGPTLIGHNENDPNDWVRSVAFSLDGKYVATSSRSDIMIWNINNGQKTSLFLKIESEEHNISSIHFTQMGYIIASDGNTLKTWDIQNGSQIKDFSGHSSFIRSVAISNDSKILVSGSDDRTIRVWDFDNPSISHSLKEWYVGGGESIAFSPDNRTIATPSNTAIRLYNAETGEVLHTVTDAHSDYIKDIKFSIDGNSILSGANDGSVRIWELSNPHLLSALEGHSDSITCVAFSLDGNYFASASKDGAIHIWDTKTRQLISEHKFSYGVYSIAFGPNSLIAIGTYALIKGKGIFLYDLRTGEEKPLSDNAIFDGVESIMYSPDGKYIIVSESLSNRVRVLDTNTGDDVWIKQFNDGWKHRVYSTAFSASGAKFAALSASGELKIWDTTTGQVLAEIQTEKSHCTGFAFNPEWSFVAIRSNYSISIWDISLDPLLKDTRKLFPPLSPEEMAQFHLMPLQN